MRGEPPVVGFWRSGMLPVMLQRRKRARGPGMSWQPASEPRCTRAPTPSIELVVEGRARDLPSLSVLRTLPVRERRHVGPFVFLDHMGPVAFGVDVGLDIPPHPHIGLATVTWLFEG